MSLELYRLNGSIISDSHKTFTGMIFRPTVAFNNEDVVVRARGNDAQIPVTRIDRLTKILLYIL